MAIGFTPSYSKDIQIEDTTQQEFLALLIEAVRKTNWNITHQSRAGLIAYTNKGMFSSNAEIRVTIDNNMATIKSSSIGTEMVDWGKNRKNVEDFGRLINELRSQFSKEELSEKFTEVEGKLIAEEEDILKSPSPTVTENFSNFFSIFKPTQGYFITPILVNANIFIFAVMVFCGVDFLEPGAESLISWGANFRPLTLEGQWWRLLTNCFLHFGLFHLLMNMFALVYIGKLLEPHLGRIRFLSAYLLSGLLASVASLWWHDLIVSAGASGAIFGLYGVFLALLTTDLFERNARKALLTSISIFVVYNLLNGLKGGIDNAAHIGGLIGGLIIGYIYTISLDEDENQKLKLKVVGSLTIAFTVISSIVYNSLTNDMVVYESRMKEFVEMEKMALEIYNQASYYHKDDLLYNIKERGIYYWIENINLINEVDKLNLPEHIHQRNSKIKLYCELRIKTFELLYKTVSEDTDKYKKEIINYDNRIQSISDELLVPN